MNTAKMKAQTNKKPAEKQSKSAFVPKDLQAGIRRYAKEHELIYDTQIAEALEINFRTLKNVFSGRCSPDTIEKIKLKIAA